MTFHMRFYWEGPRTCNRSCDEMQKLTISTCCSTTARRLKNGQLLTLQRVPWNKFSRKNITKEHISGCRELSGWYASYQPPYFTVFTMTTVTTTETTSFIRFCLHWSPMSRGHLFTISSALSSKPVATSMVNLNSCFNHRKNQIIQTLHSNTTLDQARKPPFYFLQITGKHSLFI